MGAGRAASGREVVCRHDSCDGDGVMVALMVLLVAAVAVAAVVVAMNMKLGNCI